MNKSFRKTSFCLFLFSVFYFSFFFFSFAATPQELKESIDQKSRELQEINDKIRENQKNLEETKNQGNTLKQEVGKIDKNIKQVDLGIRSSEIIVNKLGLEINSLEYDIADSEKSIALKKEAIIKTLQEFQSKDNESIFIILLKNKSLAESVFETQNLTILSDNLSAEIADLTNAKFNLAEKLKETAGKKELTETERKNLKNKKIILDDLKEDKQLVLSQTKNQEQAYQKLAGDLAKRQAEIAVEIEKLEEKLRESFDQKNLSSQELKKLSSPILGSPITQKYGATTFAQKAYKTKFHNGIDFGAPIGTPIYASEDGEIFAVGNNGRVQYGKFIMIKHQNGLATLYAHLSRQIVGVNSLVKKGDIIGYSGNTGYSTGPHLHFGVYWAPSLILKSFPGAGSVPVGVTINPADYL